MSVGLGSYPSAQNQDTGELESNGYKVMVSAEEYRSVRMSCIPPRVVSGIQVSYARTEAPMGASFSVIDASPRG